MSSSVKVSVPGSIANLGPGFDVFALSLNNPLDVAEASLAEEFPIINLTGRDAEDIPDNPSKNAVTIAASRVTEILDEDQGIEFKIEKGIPIERGLGSSGASAVAGAIAANELFEGGLSDSQLIEAAAYAEEQIAGSIHYDNVTASTVGGFIVISSVNPLEYLRLELPPMKVVIASPETRASTKEGREILSEDIPLHKVSGNVGRASTMIAALKESDLPMFARNMIDDLIEPIRASKIPGIEDAKEAAINAGALGAAMSGAGPSVFAILEPEMDSGEVKKAMKEAFEREGLECEVFDTEPGSIPKIEVR